MSQKSQVLSQRDLTIDSNWIVTIGMALLFLFIAFLLGWSIRNLFFDKFEYAVLPRVHTRWLDALTNMIGAIYSLLFAYSFPGKLLKSAFLLLAAKYIVYVALAYLHVATDTQHLVAVAMALASQTAYAIILVSIAQWFKTVIRRVPATGPGISGS